jgi:hypothetical protein
LICSYCNHENPDNFYFCGACGKPVRSAVSKLEPGFQTEPQKDSRSQETSTSATDRTSLRAAKDDVRGASLSTIDPELYPRREGEIPQPLRLPNGYRSSLLGLSPETDEPQYSYLLEDDRPSRWRFLTTAIILFLLGGLAYWQISLHGGVSGVVNAFRSRPQQDQQRRAEVPHPAAPADNTAADANAATDSASGSSADQPPQPAQNASTAKPSTEVAPDSKPAQVVPSQKRTASSSPASAPTTTTDSDATAKSASDTTQQASLRHSETPAEAPSDDETTRLAEKYLYGQGVPQDCGRAVDLIKPAASSDNPKAQSMLGTMYATGHCVPRDLPTSYRYFALALHQQPRNQWVEKDMEMVWNQMSSSEKQLATRLAK